jgi:hypothetical protein
MPRNDLLLVLGYGRSGTSALTRVLSLSGYGLPKNVFGATGLNPTGHWEPADAARLNLEFVIRHRLESDITMRLEELQLPNSDRESFISEIRKVLRAAGPGPLVIKELYINELTDFWIEAARREERSESAVIAVRHPEEVFRSVTKGFAPRRSDHPVAAEASSGRTIEPFNALWLKANLRAERNTRGIPRVFVEYSNLISDWRREVSRMQSALSADLAPDAGAIEKFLTPDLHRQRYSGPVTETFAYSWMTRLYAVLSAAANDVPVDTPTMDEIYHGYRLTSRAFRIAIERSQSGPDAQTLRNLVDRMPVWTAGKEF